MLGLSGYTSFFYVTILYSQVARNIPYIGTLPEYHHPGRIGSSPASLLCSVSFFDGDCASRRDPGDFCGGRSPAPGASNSMGNGVGFFVRNGSSSVCSSMSSPRPLLLGTGDVGASAVLYTFVKLAPYGITS